MRKKIKKFIPQKIKHLIGVLNKLFNYASYDSNEYWKTRAANEGQTAVLWKNQEYNNLYREDQIVIIGEHIKKLSDESRVLDIGCGIGVVSKMISEINEKIKIDAVDFDEMIRIAKVKNPGVEINYIANSAENFYQENYKYDLVISSACFSAIRKIKCLERALENSAKMIKDGGLILMIDPFHRWNYLARAKYNSSDVESKMKAQGLSLVRKSGILFWPYRVALANSSIYGQDLEKRYRRGEKLLGMMGQHFWADYKILVFKKNK
jgi:2-polyprenyl-3-methyl-5-hydroxy-6-metoxy-1,4-benzoquinol methylase